MTPKEILAVAAKEPYDAPDTFWKQTPALAIAPPPATDPAHAAARGIIAELWLRPPFRHALFGLTGAQRAEVVGAIAAIIREAK